MLLIDYLPLCYYENGELDEEMLAARSRKKIFLLLICNGMAAYLLFATDFPNSLIDSVRRNAWKDHPRFPWIHQNVRPSDEYSARSELGPTKNTSADSDQPIAAETFPSEKPDINASSIPVTNASVTTTVTIGPDIISNSSSSPTLLTTSTVVSSTTDISTTQTAIMTTSSSMSSSLLISTIQNLSTTSTVLLGASTIDGVNSSTISLEHAASSLIPITGNQSISTAGANTENSELDPPRRLFPEDNPSSDRILEQMAYKPGKVKDRNVIIFSPSGFGVSGGDSRFKGCPVSNCEFVDNLANWEEKADAVMLHEWVSGNFHQRDPRTAHQIWMYHSLESASNRQMSGEVGAGVINWTATYRFDSDLVTPYERFVPYDNFTKPSEKPVSGSKKKTGEIAWFVSNCGGSNNRFGYVKELKKHIAVDIYGACGKNSCPRNSNCQNEIIDEHYFYLAFENSNCKDYITEKFFQNALRANTVPVVMGASKESYLRAAPPNSFIHVDDFKSPQDLAQYLKSLVANQAEYEKFLEWKGTGRFIDTKFFCRICAMLNDPPRKKSYPDFVNWWNGQGVCWPGYQD